MKISCDVIRDLMPLYEEKLSSEASNKLIKEHIKECTDCYSSLSAIELDLGLRVTETKKIDELSSKFLKRIKNKLVLFRIFAVIILIIIASASYSVFYIENQFNKPYRIAQEFLLEAKKNKSISSFLISEEQWEEIKAYSKYGVIRESLNWEEFRDIVQSNKASQLSIGVRYRFIDKVGMFKMDTREMGIYIFDSMGNEVAKIPLLMEKINNQWMVVGKGKTNI